jgi:hypothetical protein
MLLIALVCSLLLAFFNVRHLPVLSDNVTGLQLVRNWFATSFSFRAVGKIGAKIGLSASANSPKFFFLLNIYIYIYIIFFLF